MATLTPTVVGSTIETSSDGSLTIPNTTPPVVGDFLVAFIGGYASGSSRTLGTTPSGWTLHSNITGDEEVSACYTKTADAADVSAGTFGPFNLSSTADVFIGTLIKVTNIATGQEVAGSEADSNTSGSSITATTNLTATTPDSLLLSMYFGADGDGSVISIGTYVSTPSLTWTELVDLQGDNGTPVATLSVASAPNTGTSTITSRGATASANFNDTFDSIAVLLNGKQDVSGTNALHSVSPTHLAQAGVAGTTGTNTLLAVSPTMLNQSGLVIETPTVWTPEVKTATTWTPEIK